jgi:hypothetical protein
VINEQIQVITKIEIEAEVRESRREERNRDEIPTPPVTYAEKT